MTEDRAKTRRELAADVDRLQQTLLHIRGIAARAYNDPTVHREAFRAILRVAESNLPRSS